MNNISKQNCALVIIGQTCVYNSQLKCKSKL